MTAPTSFGLVVFIILVALTFDFLNGFHDAANSIATVVSTRVLSPQKAVLWAAFFNFIAAFVMGTAVAKTMGKGMIDLSVVTNEVILAGLLGAIVWNLFTWYYGLPVSSSHALIGGYAGAALAKAGPGAILVSGWTKTLIFIVMAPLMGLFVGPPMSEWNRPDAPPETAVIYIFQGPLEESCASRKELGDQIRITLFHELGHCLGFDEDGLKRIGLE